MLYSIPFSNSQREYHHYLLTIQLEQIKSLQRSGTVEHEFSIFWVPRRTLVSDKILEDEGVLGDVNIAEFALFFLPLESDVLSLELEDAFTDLYLVGLSTNTSKEAY